MHKNISVLSFSFDDYGNINKIKEFFNFDHIPIGLKKSNRLDKFGLNHWWVGRAIPATRDGLNEFLNRLEISSPKILLKKSFGLSLSDQYWICPETQDLSWEKVNFFDNDFSLEVGRLIFGHIIPKQKIDLISPDNTSDGWLKKKWIIECGKRRLVKASSLPYHQEAINEYVATEISNRLGIKHTPYQVLYENEKYFSVCDNFVTQNTELVTATQILESTKKSNNDSTFTHFKNCCELLGLEGTQTFLNKMLTLDFLIVNTDRHFNNFGVLRNADTLTWIGFAPVFDSGTSMWHNIDTNDLVSKVNSQDSKPFKNTHLEQIKLVNDFSWLDHKTLENLPDMVYKLFKVVPNFNSDWAEALGKAVSVRANILQEIANDPNSSAVPKRRKRLRM
jgi:hypothetical protein